MIEAPRHHHLQRAQRLQLVHAAHPARNAREQRGTGKRPQGVVHVERCYSTRAQGTGRGRCRHSARRANVHRPLSTSTPSSARWRPFTLPAASKNGMPLSVFPAFPIACLAKQQFAAARLASNFRLVYAAARHTEAQKARYWDQ